MRRVAEFTRSLISDRFLFLMVLLVAGCAGTWRLYVLPELLDRPSWYNTYVGRFSPNLVTPVMLAMGWGFVEPAEGDHAQAIYPGAPYLTRFLRGEIMHISPSQIPHNLPVTKPGSDWAYRHRYLLYAIGFSWRLFGISWHVITFLRVSIFCMVAGLIYGLLRLGVRPLLAASGVVLLSLKPDIILHSANIRDFSKGPFILAALLLMGYLCRYSLKSSTYFTLSALLGGIIGVGVGFRADMYICLFPAIVVLLLCHRPGPRFQVRERAGALLLLLAFFGAPAAPILHSSGEDALLRHDPAHDVLMGLATKNDDMLGLSRASYEKVYVNQDDYIAMLASHFNFSKIPNSAPAPRDPVARRPLLTQIIRTFPADFLTRAYASVLWVARSGAQSMGSIFLMTLCAAAALFIIATRDLRTAWLAFGLFLYFSSYISLQAETRHAFHLTFIPPWIMLFLINAGVSWIFGNATLQGVSEGEKGPALPYIEAGRIVRAVLGFAIPAVILLVVPLFLARAYQRTQVNGLLHQYEQAELKPIPTVARPLDGWTMFERKSFTVKRAHTRNVYQGEMEYWVAEFVSSDRWRPIWVQYLDESTTPNFTHGLHIAPTGGAQSGNVRYYFPVVSLRDFPWSRWALFAGIAVPNEFADDFRGLYRVRRPSEFPMLLNLTLSEDREVIGAEQLLFGNTSMTLNAEAARYWLWPLERYQMPSINGLADLNTAKRQLLVFEALLKKYPGYQLARLGFAAALAHQADESLVLPAYRQAISADPAFFLTYQYTDEYLVRSDNAIARVEFWEDVASSNPKYFLPLFYLGQACAELQDWKRASEVYEKMLLLVPDDIEVFKDFENFFTEKSMTKLAFLAGQKVMEIDHASGSHGIAIDKSDID